MITAQIIGAPGVIQHLEGFPPRLLGLLKADISRLAIKLLRHVKEDKLSGQVLHNRTGTLRRKINQRVEISEHGITGIVGVKLAYAAVHEFGFTGQVTVKSHLRQIKQAFGKPITPVTAQVQSFSRMMKLPERSFLRSALRDMEPEIERALQAAVQKAVAQA